MFELGLFIWSLWTTLLDNPARTYYRNVSLWSGVNNKIISDLTSMKLMREVLKYVVTTPRNSEFN